MMRSMQSAGGEVHKERLVRRQCVLRLHPADRLVRHINSKMITRIVRRLYPDGSIKDGRRPLIGLATYETIEFIETRMSGPAVKWPRYRDLPWRRFMILAKRSGAIAI